MKKYYNFETKNFELVKILSDYMKKSNIYYELSKAYTMWHFEIYANQEEKEKIEILIIIANR